MRRDKELENLVLLLGTTVGRVFDLSFVDLERSQVRKLIEDQIAKTLPSLESGQSDVPGMTYEEGVDTALRWVKGDTDDPPEDAMDPTKQLDEILDLMAAAQEDDSEDRRVDIMYKLRELALWIDKGGVMPQVSLCYDMTYELRS